MEFVKKGLVLGRYGEGCSGKVVVLGHEGEEVEPNKVAAGLLDLKGVGGAAREDPGSPVEGSGIDSR